MSLQDQLRRQFLQHNEHRSFTQTDICRCDDCKTLVRSLASQNEHLNGQPKYRQWAMVFNEIKLSRGEHTRPLPGNYSRREAQPQPQRKERRMSSVNICDRCGAMVKGNALANNLMIINQGDYDNETRFSKDLCPGCAEELYDWLMTEVDAKQRAYHKPFNPEDREPKSVAETLASAPLTEVVEAAVKAALRATRAIEAPTTGVAEPSEEARPVDTDATEDDRHRRYMADDKRPE